MMSRAWQKAIRALYYWGDWTLCLKLEKYCQAHVSLSQNIESPSLNEIFRELSGSTDGLPEPERTYSAWPRLWLNLGTVNSCLLQYDVNSYANSCIKRVLLYFFQEHNRHFLANQTPAIFYISTSRSSLLCKVHLILYRFRPRLQGKKVLVKVEIRNWFMNRGQFAAVRQ